MTTAEVEAVQLFVARQERLALQNHVIAESEDLVLERLPNGEFAWLRREVSQPEPVAGISR